MAGDAVKLCLLSERIIHNHRPLVPPVRGFARAAEITEMNDFSIAVDPAHLSGTGTPAMEKYSAAFAAGKAMPDKLF